MMNGISQAMNAQQRRLADAMSFHFPPPPSMMAPSREPQEPMIQGGARRNPLLNAMMGPSQGAGGQPANSIGQAWNALGAVGHIPGPFPQTAQGMVDYDEWRGEMGMPRLGNGNGLAAAVDVRGQPGTFISPYSQYASANPQNRAASAASPQSALTQALRSAAQFAR